MNANPEDVPAIRRYLAALKDSLRQTQGVGLEEGLADAHEFLRSEWESIEHGRSFPADEDLYRHFVDQFGPPDEVAAAYASASDSTPSVAEPRRATLLHDAETTSARPLAAPSARRARFRPVWIKLILGLIAVQLACLLWIFFPAQLKPATASAQQGGPVWASRVVSFAPGEPHSVKSNDPASALGPPDYQDGVDESTQYHAWVSLGQGGQLVVEFTGKWLCDGSGPDLTIVELGPLAEPVDVAVSGDGHEWIEVGRAKGAEATIDLAPFVRPTDRFRWVRLTDVGTVQAPDNEWPGADIDAVGALHVANQ